MSSRESILNSVRQALKRKAGDAPAPPPAVRIRVPEIADRVTMFRERLEALGGKVYIHKPGEVLDVLSQIVASCTVVASNATLLVNLGVTSMANLQTGFQDEQALRECCAKADFGITSADYALAETGSIVTIASSEARLISLLPPQHIAIVPVSRLITGLDELYSLHPKPAELASSMVVITGPSRSADIEMILVRGVHGPRVIHVILVEEAD